MSRRDAEAASGRGGERDDPSLDDEIGEVILDCQWARQAPVHELSARGRSLQRRLQRPAPAGRPTRRPRAWKRFRFWLFRLTRGR